MSPPGHGNGGHPRPGPATAELTNTELDPHAEASHLHLTGNKAHLTSAGVPVAVGRELAQDRLRRYPLVVVEDCPFGCGGAHRHRGAGIRESGCGRPYVVVVTA